MATANQKAMDAMFERMKAIVAGNGKGQDKETTPPAGNVNPGNSNGGTKRNRRTVTSWKPTPANVGRDGSR